MKLKPILLFPLALAVGSAFGQTTDADAIKAVIRRETQAYWAADAKTFRDCWANLPEAKMLYHSAMSNKVGHGHLPKYGPDQIATRKPVEMKIKTTNEQVRITGNAAFVQYDQHATRQDGAQDYSHQTRYLEKINGAWKIVHVGSLSYQFEAGTK
jgi:ketosteroid isomerase-like protein